ncbi:MAG: hypothetical protein ACI841_002455, partial [Planctomycetota bacterium]
HDGVSRVYISRHDQVAFGESGQQQLGVDQIPRTSEVHERYESF